jgi:hypothetical protein
MDFRQIAGDLILHAHEERWTKTEAKIEAALEEMYRLGFLDGEASVKQPVPSHSCEDFTYRGVPCPHCDSDILEIAAGVEF